MKIIKKEELQKKIAAAQAANKSEFESRAGDNMKISCCKGSNLRANIAYIHENIARVG